MYRALTRPRAALRQIDVDANEAAAKASAPPSTHTPPPRRLRVLFFEAGDGITRLQARGRGARDAAAHGARVRHRAQECGIMAMPTFLLFRAGDKVAQLEGADPARLRELIAEHAGA